jgi:hypothetical protein
MNFGYLIIVSKNESVDYLKLAYALALSIKNTQKPGYDKVALVIDDKTLLENIKSPWVFDHITEWNQETFWDGRSWMDRLTPWEYTVCLDADMLFLRDYSHWIDYFIENCELYVPNRSFTYRGEVITNDFYRRCFTRNDLPNLYSMWTWFRKDSKLVEEFFSLGRYILKNPKEFSNLFLTEFKPKVIGTDEAFALSSKILDIQDDISYDLEFPRIVHMKGEIQNWPWPADKFTNHIGFYLNKDAQLKIGNYQQHDIVHYVEKDLITDEAVSILEEIAWKPR